MLRKPLSRPPNEANRGIIGGSPVPNPISAAAQHIAGAMVARFRRERPAWPALALTTNTSILTAIGNDYSYAEVFARQAEGLVSPGDVAIGISTSGNSTNVVAGLRAARSRGAWTVALTGAGGGLAGREADFCLAIPSKDTPRVQEAHITLLHIVCDLVEAALCATDECEEARL